LGGTSNISWKGAHLVLGDDGRPPWPSWPNQRESIATEESDAAAQIGISPKNTVRHGFHDVPRDA